MRHTPYLLMKPIEIAILRNTMNKKKIFVSHSGRQHVHQLLYGLQQHQVAYHFFTSFWYKASQFPFRLLSYLPKKISQKIIAQFKKRSYDLLNDANISIFPWFEFVREVADKIVPYSTAEYFLFWRDRLHDRWAASKLNNNYSVVVGYEECCLHTFRKAKKLGLKTVLDLAQIHYKEIEVISKQFPVFSEIYANQKLRSRINTIKEEELALADHIICLSSFAKDSLLKHGIPASKIEVMNLGFDPQKFIPKSNYAVDSQKKIKLVFAGTLTKRKGLDQLFRLLDDFPNEIELCIVGAVADAGDLFNKYKSRITWHQYLEQEDMNKVFNDSDVFVFPSYLDSWAMVVVEAMACGLPVIVSDNTGSKDTVTAACGEIIPAGNYEKLKEKIHYICLNKNDIATKGEAAKTQVMQYTWQKYYHQIASFFDKIQSSK